MRTAGFLSILGALLCAAQTITPLSDRADGLSAPVLSPDGTTLAYGAVSPDYNIWIDVRPLSSGKAVHFAGWQDEGGPDSPHWSPDGTQIAFLRFYCHQCNEKLFVKDYPNGSERLLGEVCGGTPSWTPDGHFLIATELAGKDPGWDPCRLVLIPLGGGVRVRLARDGDQLALSADGKRLGYAAGNVVKTVHLNANYRFADAPVEIATEPHAVSSLHWSSDGRTLIYQVWNYTKGVTAGVSRLIQTGAPVHISQILADGSALGTEDRLPRALWRVDLKAAGLEPEKVRDIPWTDEGLSVSSDGEWLAFTTSRNGPTQIWVSRMDGSDARVLIPAIPPFDRYGDNTLADGTSWSPDGKWIAMQTDPGIGHGDTSERIFIVRSTGGRLRKVLDLGSGRGAPLWTEDSKAFYVVKFSDDYKESYFLANIDTGELTAIAKEKFPKLPLVPLPEGSGPPHVAEGGHFLYYEAPVERKPRLIKVEGLVPR